MLEDEHIKKLLIYHNLRLQKLEDKKAIQGINTPPEILVEIENIKSEIESLQMKMVAQKDLSRQTDLQIESHQRTSNRVDWVADHGLYNDQFQDRFYELSDKGYRLTVLCNYEVNNQVKH